MLKRRTDRRRRRLSRLLLLAALGVAGAVLILSRLLPGISESPPQREEITIGTSAPAIAASADAAGEYTAVSLSADEVGKGYLILVNNDTLYREDITSDSLVNVFENKSSAFKVKDKSVYLEAGCLSALNALMEDAQAAKGIDDVIVWSGFRDLESQRRIYAQREDELGAAEAALYVAVPYGSEHHTGLAFDLGIYTALGQSKDFTDQGKYAYISERMADYGFIRRYRDEKQEITHVADEPWHFRYVGIPHAQIMDSLGLCLEEYTDYLKGYPFDSGHLYADAGAAGSYEIYYVAAGQGSTQVPVPADREYTVSGNNVDGFIVTARLS